MNKLMAKELMSLGHLWHLPSFPFFRSHKHLDWKRMSWVKRSGQSGKYSYNMDSGIMDSCGSGSGDSSILEFVESSEEFVLNWVILTDKHFGHNRPLDVRGTYPKQSLDFLPWCLFPFGKVMVILLNSSATSLPKHSIARDSTMDKISWSGSIVS